METGPTGRNWEHWEGAGHGGTIKKGLGMGPTGKIGSTEKKWGALVRNWDHQGWTWMGMGQPAETGSILEELGALGKNR